MENPLHLAVKGLGLQRHDDTGTGKGVVECTHASRRSRHHGRVQVSIHIFEARHYVELNVLITFLQGNSLHYLQNRRLGGHTAGLGPCGEEENLLSLPEIG